MNGPAQGPFDRATRDAADGAADDATGTATGGAQARGRGARKGTRATRDRVDPPPGLFDGRRDGESAAEHEAAHEAAHGASPATQPVAEPAGGSGMRPSMKPGVKPGSKPSLKPSSKPSLKRGAKPDAIEGPARPSTAMQEPATGARAAAATPARPRDTADATRPEIIPGAAWMERMRPYRALRQREISIGAAILSIEQSMGRRQDALGDVIEVWNRLVPAALAGSVAIAGLARGTLTLSVAGSAASYELGRLLRGGLERALVAELPGRVRRVKVVHSGADGR